MSALNGRKSGLITPVRRDIPVICETTADAEILMEVVPYPDVPSREPSETELDMDLPQGNKPVNVYELRGSIGTYTDALSRLQGWFEAALQVLRDELALVKAVEDLALTSKNYIPYDFRSSSGRSCVWPIAYDPQNAGLFVAFMYARLAGKIWKIFGGPTLAQQVYGTETQASPLSLVKILLKSARLAGIIVLQAVDRRNSPTNSSNRDHGRTRVSEHQAVLAHFRDSQDFSLPSALQEYPFLNPSRIYRHSAMPSSTEGIGGGSLTDQISRHYNRLMDLVRADRREFEPYLIPNTQCLLLCTSDHPRPSVLFANNLAIIEDSMWDRYFVEHAHAEHHLRMTQHMRLNKGGVKKGRKIYGLDDQVAKELAEIYSDPSDVVEGLVKDGAMDIERQLQKLFDKLQLACNCDKVFHLQLIPSH